MAFVRTKKISGNYYRYLVKNYRDENGNVRQKVLQYLGPASSKTDTDFDMDEVDEEVQKELGTTEQEQEGKEETDKKINPSNMDKEEMYDTEVLNRKNSVWRVTHWLSNEVVRSRDHDNYIYTKDTKIVSKIKDDVNPEKVKNTLKHFKLGFGKYEGKNLYEVFKEDYNYFHWMSDSKLFDKALKAEVENLEPEE